VQMRIKVDGRPLGLCCHDALPLLSSWGIIAT
jgi:hypothetical protein